MAESAPFTWPTTGTKDTHRQTRGVGPRTRGCHRLPRGRHYPYHHHPWHHPDRSTTTTPAPPASPAPPPLPAPPAPPLPAPPPPTTTTTPTPAPPATPATPALPTPPAPPPLLAPPALPLPAAPPPTTATTPSPAPLATPATPALPTPPAPPPGPAPPTTITGGKPLHQPTRQCPQVHPLPLLLLLVLRRKLPRRTDVDHRLPRLLRRSRLSSPKMCAESHRHKDDPGDTKSTVQGESTSPIRRDVSVLRERMCLLCRVFPEDPFKETDDVGANQQPLEFVGVVPRSLERSGRCQRERPTATPAVVRVGRVR